MIVIKKGNNPLQAIGYFFQGLKLLFRPELRTFVVVPIAINTVLYSIALFLGYRYTDELIARFIPDWLQWLNWIIWPLFFISVLIIGFFTFTVMANLLAAPFYGKLAAKTLAVVAGRRGVISEPPMAKVVASEFRRAGYFSARAVPLLLLFVIPGINLVAPFAWGLFGAWAMAMEYMAYPLENEGLLFSEQKELAKTIRFGAMSFGGIVMAGLALPVVNIVVAPAAVIGATLFINDVKEKC
ncbi:MAG: sulfate transporter CysZ [Gammaproteobacteria bacterium]